KQANDGKLIQNDSSSLRNILSQDPIDLRLPLHIPRVRLAWSQDITPACRLRNSWAINLVLQRRETRGGVLDGEWAVVKELLLYVVRHKHAEGRIRLQLLEEPGWIAGGERRRRCRIHAILIHVQQRPFGVGGDESEPEAAVLRANRVEIVGPQVAQEVAVG